MAEDTRYEYACPRCGAGLKTDLGYCPECGFIGHLEHRVLRLTAMTAAGKLVISEPPLQVPKKKLQAERSGNNNGALGYRCPRCGARTGRAFGRCPDSRTCGYVGPMQSIAARGEEVAK